MKYVLPLKMLKVQLEIQAEAVISDYLGDFFPLFGFNPIGILGFYNHEFISFKKKKITTPQ